MGNKQNSDCDTSYMVKLTNENCITLPKAQIIKEADELYGIIYSLTDNIKEYEIIFSKYSSEVKIYFYKYKAITYLQKKNTKSQIIAKFLPSNNELLCVTYINAKIDINLLTIMRQHLNFDKIDKNKNTFLYKLNWNNLNLDYVMEIINIYNININHQNKWGKTFLMDIAFNVLIDEAQINKYMQFIESLINQNYDFNLIDRTGQSLLTQFIKYQPHLCFYFYNLIKIKTYDITKECEWLYKIINKHFDDSYNYFWRILNRTDYERCLYDIFINYHYPSYEDDFTMILITMNKIEESKVIDMLNYKNTTNGNTILHEIATRRGKKLLSFINHHYKENLIITLNNENKCPSQLYIKNFVEINFG